MGINLSHRWHHYRVNSSLQKVMAAGPPPTCALDTHQLRFCELMRRPTYILSELKIQPSDLEILL